MLIFRPIHPKRAPEPGERYVDASELDSEEHAIARRPDDSRTPEDDYMYRGDAAWEIVNPEEIVNDAAQRVVTAVLLEGPFYLGAVKTAIREAFASPPPTEEEIVESALKRLREKLAGDDGAKSDLDVLIEQARKGVRS